MLRDKLLTTNQKVTITRFDRKIGLTGRHTGLPLLCKGNRRKKTTGGAAYSCTAEFVIFIRERIMLSAYSALAFFLLFLMRLTRAITTGMYVASGRTKPKYFKSSDCTSILKMPW